MTRPMPESLHLPHALYRAAQVRHFDHTAIEVQGIPGIELMERAGASAYDLVRQRWPGQRRLTVLVGAGNNGGDGYVLARLAQADGLSVLVLQLADPGSLRGEAATAFAAFRDSGGRFEPFQSLPRDPGLLVDALLGTGLERPLGGLWAQAVEAANRCRSPRLAIDIPSGLHADTGAILGVAVRAEATLSFIGLKQGLFTGSGPDCCGAIHFSALGISARVYSTQVLSARRLDWRQQSSVLGPRRRGAHKGDFGHVLVVGGAPGMSGAARLAGEGALRAGSGLVTIATHPDHAGLLNLTRPELMVAAVLQGCDLEALIERAHVLAIGPGLGRGPWGRGLWRRVGDLDRPLVVDADALSLLAEDPMRRDDWILTPHPGEAARLLACTTAEVQQDRFEAARRLQDRFGGTVVLKGSGTLIQGSGHRPPGVCSDGNPGMATAGSGDVLTGVVAAFRAQGMEAEQAADLGVCLHAAAGDRAARAGEKGMLAGDILAALRPVANGVAAE